MASERNEDTTEPSTEHRRRSPLAIAAVAAAVLVAGGGGAYWATTNAGGSTAGASHKNGTPAPLVLSGGTDGHEGAAVPGGPVLAGGQYRAIGSLPSGPKSAPVYRPQGQVPRETVEALAKALGVPGPVKLDHDFWKAGGAPGTPYLQVNRNTPGGWAYTRSGAALACGTPAGSAQDTDVCSGTTRSDEAPAGSAGGTNPVSEQQAKQAAAPVLATLGLGSASADASGTAGAVRTVTADPVVGGLPTHGWRTFVRVGADGKIASGYGLLSALAKGDDYPVVSAEQALKDLNKSGKGSGDHGIANCPVTTPKPPTDPTDDKKLPQVLPCLPSGGGPLEVRGAVFGLSAQFAQGGQVLVPSWLFQVAQSGVQRTHTVAQQAVAPEYVRRSGPGTASAPGATQPTNPVDPADPQMPADPMPGGQVRPVPMKAESYSVEGNTLRLHFWGGVCSNYSASAQESATAVMVRITGTPKHPGQVCVLLAKSLDVEVRLQQPLGDRKVVDASDGHMIAKQ